MREKGLRKTDLLKANDLLKAKHTSEHVYPVHL